AYDLARAGAEVELAPREIGLRHLQVAAAGLSDEGAYLDVELATSKGYYVRSFARDLGESIGVPSHLARLRRTQSGSFTAAEAILLSEPDALRAALVPIAECARRVLASAILTPDGLVRARHGKPLSAAD